MKNYGCGYCNNRDTLHNKCRLGRELILEESGLNIEDNGCEEYYLNKDAPKFFCAITNRNLDNPEEIPNYCMLFKPIEDDCEFGCGYCEYFRDNTTPDTIIKLTLLGKMGSLLNQE